MELLIFENDTIGSITLISIYLKTANDGIKKISNKMSIINIIEIRIILFVNGMIFWIIAINEES